MAPSASSHTFQKLKLDTTPLNKPKPSAFASFPRQEQSHITTAELAGAQPQNIHSGAWKRDHHGTNGYPFAGAIAVGSSALTVFSGETPVR